MKALHPFNEDDPIRMPCKQETSTAIVSPISHMTRPPSPTPHSHLFRTLPLTSIIIAFHPITKHPLGPLKLIIIFRSTPIYA